MSTDAPTQKIRFFLDATPLLDAQWTGIPTVCAAIAGQLLKAGHDVAFCLADQVLPSAPVLDALARRSGLYLQRDVELGRLPMQRPLWPKDCLAIGLSASVKRHKRVFDIEASVIHDISTILQPYYHTSDNIIWHTETLLEDIQSNAATFTPSRATADDLVAYFGFDAEKIHVTPLGVEWPWWYEKKQKNDRDVEKYITIISTKEPRKNLAIIFTLLEKFPSLLDNYTFLFIGGVGWLSDGTVVPERLRTAIARGRIATPGFVSEYDKYRLLRGAEALIFPSFFEGFGLPVLEALSLGVPCVAAFGSSMSEVGGDLCDYFDPFSADSLHGILQATLARNGRSNAEFKNGCRNRLGAFSWEGMVNKILKNLVENAKSF